MKSILVLFILGFVISIPCTAQQTRVDFNLQGEVQEVLEVRSSVASKWQNDTATFTFNQAGILRKETNQNNNSLTCSLTKRYDEQGNFTFQKCSGCTNTESAVNSYNETGQLAYAIEKMWGLKTITTSFSYNTFKQLVSINMIDSSILVGPSFHKERINFEYDKSGNQISKTVYQADKIDDEFDLILKDLNPYNDSNKMILKKTIDHKTGVRAITYANFKYDKNGNLIWRKTTHKDSLRESITVFTYQQNQLTSEMSTITYLDKRKLKTYQMGYEYDSFGNETKYIDYGTNHIYKYEYDSRGNWVEKTIINDGVPLIKKTRAITYFD